MESSYISVCRLFIYLLIPFADVAQDDVSMQSCGDTVIVTWFPAAAIVDLVFHQHYEGLSDKCPEICCCFIVTMLIMISRMELLLLNVIICQTCSLVHCKIW